MPESAGTAASQAGSFYVGPDFAAVYKGYLIPGSNLVHAVVSQLKAQIAEDTDLAAKWAENPRAVLASRGLGISDFQNEIMKSLGLPVPEKFCDETFKTMCCETL